MRFKRTCIILAILAFAGGVLSLWTSSISVDDSELRQEAYNRYLEEVK